MTRGPSLSRLAVRSCALCVLSTAACRHESSNSSRQDPPLRADVVASVGADTIHAETVGRIARERHVDRGAATQLALQDALLAARSTEVAARAARRAAAARALAVELLRQARAAGPPTDLEVEGPTRSRWWELDRPPMRRTAHAVVLHPDPSADARARSLADRIAASMKAISDVEEFKRVARAESVSGLQVRVEDLEPVARDGRALDPLVAHPADVVPSHFDEAFVRGVFEIPAVGATSGVVRSEFGYHVIFLREVIPERRFSLEERRAMLEGEIMAQRAKRRLDDVLGAARRGTRVEVERAANELMEKVRVTP